MSVVVRPVRPYVVAGAALIAVGVTVTPIVQPPDAHVAQRDVRLVSADTSGLENIPMNLLIDIINIPYDEFSAPMTLPSDLAYATASGPVYDEGAGTLAHLPMTTDGAINELTNSLNYVGNFFEYDQTNIFGFDPGDPPKLAALVDVLVPFHTLSQPLGEQMNTIAEAEFPENATCAASCSDPIPILLHTMGVPLSQLESGYTFGNVIDQYTGEPLPYANTTVTLDPSAPSSNFLASLEASPSLNPIEPMPSLGVVSTDLYNLAASMVKDLNPYVPDNFLSKILDAPQPASAPVTDFTATLDANIMAALSAELTALSSGDLNAALTELGVLF